MAAPENAGAHRRGPRGSAPGDVGGVAGPAAGAAIAVAQNHPAEPDVPAWVYVAVPVLVVAAAAWWAARRRP